MDFNHLFILECFHYPEDREFFNTYTIPSLRDLNLSTAYQFLKKNEYLVEDPNDSTRLIISVKGQDFLLNCMNNTVEPPVIQLTGVYTGRIQLKSDEECFEEWWKAFPTSPAWKSDDGNTIFAGSRTLKNLRKAEAKKRYLKLLNQGLKHEDLLGSLLYEIKLKKVDSIKKNQNQMEYFKGIESYLNQERYLLYVDAFKENPAFVQSEKIKGKKANVTDI
jgi:hypothetical protein